MHLMQLIHGTPFFRFPFPGEYDKLAHNAITLSQLRVVEVEAKGLVAMTMWILYLTYAPSSSSLPTAASRCSISSSDRLNCCFAFRMIGKLP